MLDSTNSRDKHTIFSRAGVACNAALCCIISVEVIPCPFPLIDRPCIRRVRSPNYAVCLCAPSNTMTHAAHIVANRSEMKRIRSVMLAFALPIELIEIGTVILWVKTGLWWPFAIGMTIIAVIGTLLSLYYFRSVSYLCPTCHTGFNPRFG